MAHNSGDDRRSVTIVDIDDPAAANAGSELFDFHAVQLQSRPFKIRRIIVRLDTATVVYHSTMFRYGLAHGCAPGCWPM